MTVKGVARVAVPAVAWTLILALTALVYLPALDVGWVFDDNWNIVQFPAMHWTTVSWEGVRQVLDQTLNSRRIVANLSFALNHVVGGLDPRGYHLVNVLIHLAVGSGIVWLGLAYLQSSESRRRPTRRELILAMVPAALFLVHPLNTQAVTYVVQRMASLAALFCMLAFGSYIRGRASRGRQAAVWYVLAASFWVLALASKENAAVLPLVVLTWEWCFHWRSWSEARARWAEWSGVRRVVVSVAIVLLVSLGTYLFVRYAGLPGTWFEPLRGRDFSKFERLLTQARVGVLYLGLLLWPAPGRLNLDHDFAVSRGLLEPASTLPAVLFCAAFLAGAVYLARRRPLVGFPLLAYLGFHLIEAGPVNLELVFEHRMYLPMTMLALLAMVGLQAIPERSLRAVFLPVAAGLGIMLGVGTAARNRLWADPILFYADIATKSPAKPRAHDLLGVALLDAGRPEDAIEPFRRAIALDSSWANGYLHLGNAYLASERPGDALEVFELGLRHRPGFYPIQERIGVALDRSGRPEEAVGYYMGLGSHMAMEGRAPEAIQILQRAVTLDRTSSAAWNALGNAYFLAGDNDRAMEHYGTSVALDPNNAEALYNLARSVESVGDTAAAVAHYRRFLEVAPPSLARPRAQAQARIEELTAAVSVGSGS
jgi:tetratricopeptide (TPR) repeat protein